MSSASRFVQLWVPVLIAAWLAAYLGHSVLGHKLFAGGILDWALTAPILIVLFPAVWVAWGFVCGLVGYRGQRMMRGFEIGWAWAIDVTGRSHRFERLSRRDIRRAAERVARGDASIGESLEEVRREVFGDEQLPPGTFGLPDPVAIRRIAKTASRLRKA